MYDLNDVALSKKRIYRYLGEEERPIENHGYNTEEISKMLDVSDEGALNISLSSFDGSFSMNPRHVSIFLVRTSSSGNKLIVCWHSKLMCQLLQFAADDVWHFQTHTDVDYSRQVFKKYFLIVTSSFILSPELKLWNEAQEGVFSRINLTKNCYCCSAYSQ